MVLRFKKNTQNVAFSQGHFLKASNLSMIPLPLPFPILCTRREAFTTDSFEQSRFARGVNEVGKKMSMYSCKVQQDIPAGHSGTRRLALLESLVFMLSKGPLVRVWRKQNCGARKPA